MGNLLNPFINPDVINLSQDKTVTGFTLAFYCENEDFEALTFGDSGETISYYTYDVRIPPGEMVNPGEVNLRQYGLETHYIYLAIAKVVLEDGEIIEIPPEKLDFYFWILNDLF